MTREEINKAIEEIREHCRNNNCHHCEAFTHYGCAFMTGYPNEWLTTIELNEESEDKQ